MTPRDWLDTDEAALDSYATARTLSRLGDDRCGTLADALTDPDVEVWDPLPRAPSPGPAGRKTN